MDRQSVALTPLTGRHVWGLGLRVIFTDAFGDGLELFGLSPHGVVFAACYHCAALEVTVYQDLGCQQDQPGLDLTA